MNLREPARSILLLAARVALSGIFLFAGLRHLNHPAATAARLAAAGYPIPTVLAVVAGLALVLGSVSLLAGAFTWLGCLALVLFLVPTTLTFHLPAALQGNLGQAIQALKNLALAGGLLAVWAAGPGRLAVDHLRRKA